MDSKERAALIRQGNEFYNQGKIDEAIKIFSSVNYQDGLTRIGDYFYYDMRQPLKALKFYQKSGCTAKIDEIYQRMYYALGRMLGEEKGKQSNSSSESENPESIKVKITENRNYNEGTGIKVELPPLKVSPKLKLAAEEILRNLENKKN